MRKSLVVSSLGLLLAVTLLGTASGRFGAAAKEPEGPIARGRYLVGVLGCEDCHTPKKMGPHGPEPDMTRRLMGHPEGTKLPAPPKPVGPWVVAATGDLTAWSGPWGMSFATNLTPHENTGIGIWTEEMFVRALRTGRHMGTSRPILPPMPWQIYGDLTDDDLKAVYAFLRTLPAMPNRVPDPVIAVAP